MGWRAEPRRGPARGALGAAREVLDLVIDVRAQPGSRRSPQFGRDELPGMAERGRHRLRGWTVWHLIGDAPPRRHELGAWGPKALRDADGRLTDPALRRSAHLSRSKEE